MASGRPEAMTMEFGLHSANNAEELCFVLLGRGVGLLLGS